MIISVENSRVLASVEVTLNVLDENKLSYNLLSLELKEEGGIDSEEDINEYLEEIIESEIERQGCFERMRGGE